MIFVLFGVLLGFLIALGPLSMLSAPVDTIGAAIVTAADRGIQNLISLVGPAAGDNWVTTVSTILAVMTPGLVIMALIYSSVAAQHVRKAVSALLIAGAVASFLVLPAGDAIVLTVVAIALVALTWFGTGLIVQTPLAILATVLAVRWTVTLWTGDSQWLDDATQSLVNVAGSGQDTSDLWKVALLIAGLTPIIGAGWMLLTWGENRQDRRWRGRRDGWGRDDDLA